MPPAVVPNALASPKISVPARLVVMPVNVLAPLRVSVPGPALVKPPLAMMAETVMSLALQ